MGSRWPMWHDGEGRWTIDLVSLGGQRSSVVMGDSGEQHMVRGVGSHGVRF